jgi:succinate dehydrogenase / fumarate reductase flavoprotein subunit
MLHALERLRELRAASDRVSVDGNREYNAGWHTALDLHHLLTVSEIVTRAALERQESRGAHFRDDFPEKDNSFGAVNIVVRKGADGEMKFSAQPVPAMRHDLQQIIEEMK